MKSKNKKRFKILGIVVIIFFAFIVLISLISGNDDNSSSSSSSSSTSSKKISSKDKNKIDKLNSWYKNTKVKEINDEYTEHSDNADTVKTWRMASVVQGYQANDNELKVLISKNRIDAEKLSSDDVAKWALYGILFEYPDFDKDITGYKNIGKSTDPNDAKNAKLYIEYVQ